MLPAPDFSGKTSKCFLIYKQFEAITFSCICQSADKFPKTKIENNIRRTKPGNDQKRGNQTIAIKAAWHKQTTDTERLNGGVLKRRPMNLYGIARTNNRVVHFLTSLLKLVENRTRYPLPHMRYSLCFIRF